MSSQKPDFFTLKLYMGNIGTRSVIRSPFHEAYIYLYHLNSADPRDEPPVLDLYCWNSQYWTKGSFFLNFADIHLALFLGAKI